MNNREQYYIEVQQNPGLELKPTARRKKKAKALWAEKMDLLNSIEPDEYLRKEQEFQDSLERKRQQEKDY